MGNASDCCSEGTLPTAGGYGGYNMAGAMPNPAMTASFGPGPSPAFAPAINAPPPMLPPIMPPASMMSAMSVKAYESGIQDNGPFPKDGQFLQMAPPVDFNAMNLPPFQRQSSGNTGQTYPPFKFFKTRHVYVGEWQNHKFHGSGMLIFENGDYLVGSFSNGSPSGHCRLVLISQGSYFEGQMRNWYADGQGIFRTANGDYTYRGSFHNSHADGQGIEETPNSRFEGIFSHANKVKGVLTMNNGYLYDGDFQNNRFHGMGKLRSPNGMYIGQFQNGKKWGHGVFRWKDGSFYEGDYCNDLKHGWGRYVTADRQIIEEGEWRGGNFIGGVGGVGAVGVGGVGAVGGVGLGPSSMAVTAGAVPPMMPPGMMSRMGGMGVGGPPIPPAAVMSSVQNFAPPPSIINSPSPLPPLPPPAPRGFIETTTTTIESSPGYISPTVKAMTVNGPGGASTYTPGGMYNPATGMAPVSVYNPGTIAPVSNYVPGGLSTYNPGVMAGNSGMALRP